ncbi:MAG: diaminopimelate decarboxylase [Leptospirales bacterium]|nr:diaminopimelate decarboxylase [Leptospirales bacterium]
MALTGSLPGPLAYSGEHLHFGGLPVADLAAAFGTPLYVYSAAYLKERLESYRRGLRGRKHLLCYSVKANSNLAILRQVAGAGAGADIVSGGELYRCLQAGMPPERIVFAGVGKTEREIAEALKAGILLFSVESVAEMESIQRCAETLGARARISIRVNPDVDAATHPYISTGLKENKFGISHQAAREVYALSRQMPALQASGIGFHIGSQMLESSGVRDASAVLCALIERLRSDGFSFEHISIGGGLGIRYGAEQAPEPADFAAEAAAALPYPDATLCLEPGRSVVGNAGILLTRVLYAKEQADRRFLIVDAAMNDLIRPALYQAEHAIVSEKLQEAEQAQRWDIVGPICESADFLGRNRLLSAAADDLLCICSAGAYGFTMASNYNSRPRPAEALVVPDSEGRPRALVVRDRENYEDLIYGENTGED